MRVVAILQARMTSTRLPGKVLLDLAGKPMLERVLERVRRCREIDDLLVATTVEAADDLIALHCRRWDCPVSRGDRDDVLDRFVGAARMARADAVVRITSDCPLLDPPLADAVVRAFLDRAPGVDYASNVVPRRTFPRGLDVEVCSAAALERAWREAADPSAREHVTPYLYRRPDLFATYCLEGDADHSAHRWTVDAPEDYELVRRVYDALGDAPFGWRDVLRLLEQHPEWEGVNRRVAQKTL